MPYPKTLADFTGPCRHSGTQQVYQFCPVCQNTNWKLYVDPVTGRWFCFAGDHGGGGCVQPGGLTTDTRNRMVLEFDRQHHPHEWAEVELPPVKPLGEEAREYLLGRGFGPGVITARAIAEMVDAPRVLVPYFGSEGKIISWIARDYTDTLRDKYDQSPGAKPLYMLPRLLPTKEVIVVEGVFDAIKVRLALANIVPVIALGGTTLSALNELDLRRLVTKEVFLLLDRDTAGIKGTAKLTNQLRDRYNVVDLAPVILQEGEDPGQATKEALSQIRRFLR